MVLPAPPVGDSFVRFIEMLFVGKLCHANIICRTDWESSAMFGASLKQWLSNGSCWPYG